MLRTLLLILRTLGLLLLAQKHRLRCQQLDVRNSGDTEGDRRRVVGYGAFALMS
jgi:hypothetical protein